MQILLLLSLIIAILAVLFAVQNIDTVTIRFLTASFQGSLALILLVAMVIGSSISLLASLPTLIRNQWIIRGQRKKMAELEISLANHKMKLAEAENKLLAKEQATSDVPTSLPAGNL